MVLKGWDERIVKPSSTRRRIRAKTGIPGGPPPEPPQAEASCTTRFELSSIRRRKNCRCEDGEECTCRGANQRVLQRPFRRNLAEQLRNSHRLLEDVVNIVSPSRKLWLRYKRKNCLTLARFKWMKIILRSPVESISWHKTTHSVRVNVPWMCDRASHNSCFSVPCEWLIHCFGTTANIAERKQGITQPANG